MTLPNTYTQLGYLHSNNGGGGSFDGIEFKDNLIIDDNPLSFNITESLEFVANYDVEKYNVTTSVNPTGAGTTSGDGEYQVGASVTISATAGEHKIFTNWTQNGTIVSTNETYTFTMPTADITLTAVFDNEPIYKIEAKCDPIVGGTAWSNYTSVWGGGSATFKAHAHPGYEFICWSNGSTSNPYTILSIGDDISLTAMFVKDARNESHYAYRAYIKSQYEINKKAKAFVEVDTYTIRRDLLCGANSEFVVYDLPEEVTEGDIFVLYNPYGKTIYHGKITTLTKNEEYEDKDITKWTVETDQIQSIYNDNWLYDNYSTAGTYEGEFAYLLDRYQNGYMKGNTTYQDTLRYAELAPLKVKTSTSNTGKFEVFKNAQVYNLTDYIYDLYDKHSMVLDFYIPFGEWNIGDSDGGSVTINVPAETPVKIADNSEYVINMEPSNETADINTLIIYSSKGVYRTTWTYSAGSLVEKPTATTGRIMDIKTKIVFSDDNINTLKGEYLNTDMYNHKVEFDLVIDNPLYDFESWHLGQKLNIFSGKDYFESVFTGYEISGSATETPYSVHVICGKVRNTLTQKLMRGIAK